MKRWLFILGRQADIAFAELLSVLKTLGVQYKPERAGSHEMIIEVAEATALFLEPQKLLNRLGGCIKIVLLKDRLPLDRADKFGLPLSDLIKGDVLMRNYMPKNGRWTFGFSAYAPDFTVQPRTQLKELLHKIGIKVKSDVKARKRSARFVAVRGKDLALSGVVVRKNGLHKNSGTDIAILIHDRQIERGHTVAVQDF